LHAERQAKAGHTQIVNRYQSKCDGRHSARAPSTDTWPPWLSNPSGSCWSAP